MEGTGQTECNTLINEASNTLNYMPNVQAGWPEENN